MRCITIFVTLLLCALPIINAGTLASYTPQTNQNGEYTAQFFTVPPSVYRIKITATGAAGGKQFLRSGGRGRGMSASGTFFVNPQQLFTIIVGVEGGTSLKPYYYSNAELGGGGGGGGSFVYTGQGAGARLYVAGGGGGGASLDKWSDPDYLAYGLDGNAGTAGTATAEGVTGGTSGNAGADGGKGWNIISMDLINGPMPTNRNGQAGAGGWGGGGAGIHSNPVPNAGGGGGGYSGGNGGTFGASGGGGGGSYVDAEGASPTFALAADYVDGSVVIATADTCGANSDFDLAKVMCLCRSGYYGAGCTKSAADVGCPAFVPQANVTFKYPEIAGAATSTPELKPKLEKDNLYLWIMGDYVETRRYLTVNFRTYKSPAGGPGAAPVNSSCNFAGKNPYWKKDFTSGGVGGCKDLLNLTLPWSKAGTCMFTKKTTGDMDDWSSTIEMQFSEDMGTSFGVPLIRTSVHTYDVVVSFPNKLVVELNNTVVKAEVQLDIVLTNERYEPSTQLLTLEFTTVTPWSGKLDTNMTVTPPGNVSVVSGPTARNSDATCSATGGSSCAQVYEMTFKINNNETIATCNFNGKYELSSTIHACRNYKTAETPCASKTVGITFQLSSGSVCASVAVKPSIKGSMNAFSSTDFTALPATAFKLGDRVYFKTTPNTIGESTDQTTQNSIKMKFTDISFTSNSPDIPGGALMQAGTVTDQGSKVNLNVFHDQKYFVIYFSGETFPIPFDTSVNFNFRATATISWGGLEKRTVEMYYDMSQMEDMASSGANMEMALNVHIVGTEKHVVAGPATQQTTTTVVGTPLGASFSLANVIGIAVGGVVVGVVLVLAVVFTVYKKMQNQFVQVPTSEPIHA